ncbi:MAG: hypothetical protein MJA28_06220 [Gammaproteobacteria bacterium]|nr:hypothetical protein [Gammaproteobacteria bacterium]
MKVLNRNIPAKEVIRMIDSRMDAVTNQYRYAVADERKAEAEAMAETKWQLAELKMQLADMLSQMIVDDIAELEAIKRNVEVKQ